MIRAQGIDGHEKDLQIARHSLRNRLKRRRAQGRSGGVLAVAILIDTVVGPIAGAGVAFGIAVVAIATAEEARVAVVVEIGQALTKREQLACQPGARRSLARGLVLRRRQDRHQGEYRQAKSERGIPRPSHGTPAQEHGQDRGCGDHADNDRHHVPGQELKILRPAQANQSGDGSTEKDRGYNRCLPPAHARKTGTRPSEQEG